MMAHLGGTESSNPASSADEPVSAVTPGALWTAWFLVGRTPGGSDGSLVVGRTHERTAAIAAGIIT